MRAWQEASRWPGTCRAAAIPDGRSPFFVVGLVLMCAGIAIRRWAITALGQFFTVDVPGMIVTFVEVGPALGNRASLAVLAVLPTTGLVIRIHDEERALLDGLGEPYRRFAASRPRLFPGLW